MTLDEIKAMWSNDCEIDDIELDKSSLDVPRLHAKYSDLLTDNILRLKNAQMQYNLLRKDKWLWFNGKLDKETIDKRIKVVSSNCTSLLLEFSTHILK